jgi:DNA-directed RNA polymerase subunit delta
MENQQSLFEAALEIISKKEGPTNIYDLINETLASKNVEDESGDLAAKLYLDITISSKFVFLGDDLWDLKSRQPLEKFEKDGSDFNSKDDYQKPERKRSDEDEDDDYDLSDDEDEDEIDHDEDEDYEDQSEDDEEYEDDLSFEDDEDEDDDDSYDDKDFDEEKYNKYMDEFEDEYKD